MSKFLSKVAVKTAQEPQKTKFDLSINHTTTQGIFKPKPVYIKEMVPGESIEINMQSFCRLDPLVRPMLANLKQKNRAFFVPMRTIMEGWNEFITRTPYRYASDQTPSIISTVKTVRNHEIIKMLVNPSYGFATKVGENPLNTNLSDGTDFHTFVKPNGEISSPMQTYVFTTKGKLAYDILLGLGYKINFKWSAEDAQDQDITMSALPLLAYTKCFYDWMSNTAYANYKEVEGYFVGKTGNIGAQDLYTIFESILKVTKEQDYFTAAWDTPNAPNGNIGVGSIDIKDITKNTGAWTNHTSTTSLGADSGALSTTPSINGNAGGAGNLNASPKAITQYMVDALHRVTDYVKRHQLSGYRALDNYATEYGFQLPDSNLNRCNFLGKFDVDIQISDVVSNTNLAGAFSQNQQVQSTGLGAMAGKGIAYGNDGNFKFETNEFGYLIIMSYIEPHLGYVHGRDRNLQHLSSLDFYHGDFDGLGVQPIRYDELSAGSTHAWEGTLSDSIFAYVPRYAEYKVAQDKLSGDFVLGSKNVNLKGWTLYRDFSPESVNDNGIPAVHNLNFTEGHPGQYDYIFGFDDATFDHIYTVFRFNVDSYMPMKRLFDNYEFDHEGARKVIDINGTNINN